MVKFYLYRGDITKLKTECIVNASNESGMGCSIIGHCLDSAIHHAAGYQLYEECKKLGGIPTTVAKITSGFNLPAKYIIHVTGPRASSSSSPDFDALAKSYTNCLEVAKANNIKEIAFCCLSTGIFGFPKKESAKVAYASVRKWLASDSYKFETIIFNVFTKDDYIIYSELLEDFICMV
jgi:O-acetyl-ADP-ribose deacetylase (regulator of RNase III)